MARRQNEVVTFDFETDAIDDRPRYPPKPVGVSIKYRGKKAKYYAFGHPTANNCTKEQAKAALRDAYRSGLPLVAQNASFDVDVAEEHFGLKLPTWDLTHDTMYLLFLHNPHARSLSLKPAAEELLGMKPDEQDAVREWLIAAGIVKKNQKDWGAHIAKAPGDLAGKYANGDTDRTEKLFDLLHPKILEAGMGAAYDRERRLMPILLQNERDGMRVDLRALERDLKLYEAASAKADAWLRKRLKAPDLNIDSDNDLADALERAGIVTEWVMTETGRRSTAKKNMTAPMFKDKRVFQALGYRGRLATCVGTFMRPWLEQARGSEGRIYTHWNQVRQAHGNESTGTRTGRLSCTPNFQNIPKDWYDKNDGYEHPAFLGVPELPMMRRYIMPEVGHLFGHRDYNQQEPRILAHFENDKLCAAYNADPRTDVHNFAQELIRRDAGLELERRAVKQVNLAIMYAMGTGTLAEKLDIDYNTAKKIKAAHKLALPGIAELEAETKQRGKDGGAVKTWGGRLYYVEPPKMIEGRLRTFEYKLLNYLIQGSASECTKEAIIRYAGMKKEARFMVTVHDECNISAPKALIKKELLILREAMESVEFDVPMITDAKAGPHWGALKSVKETR